MVDHMHIIEALERRDGELAERLVRDHALGLAAHVDANTFTTSTIRSAKGEIVWPKPFPRRRICRRSRALPPEKIPGGHLVAKALKTEGVDAIFTLCGGHIIDIYDGCIDEGIKIIDVRHEQVAAHAADGYARMTGRSAARW